MGKEKGICFEMNQPSFPLLFSGKARDLERKWKFALWNYFRYKGKVIKVEKKKSKKTLFFLIYTLLRFISAFSGKAKSIESLFFLPVSSTVSSNNTLFSIIIFPFCTCVKSEYRYVTCFLWPWASWATCSLRSTLCFRGRCRRRWRSGRSWRGSRQGSLMKGEKNKFTLHFVIKISI